MVPQKRKECVAATVEDKQVPSIHYDEVPVHDDQVPIHDDQHDDHVPDDMTRHANQGSCGYDDYMVDAEMPSSSQGNGKKKVEKDMS